MYAVFENYLIEVLLSVVLMFNVGAYSFLWYKIRGIEDMTLEHRETITKIWSRMFGFEEDPTSEGHLVETRDRFDEMNDTLDMICSKIDDIDEKRKQEHKEVRSDLRYLVSVLAKEGSEGVDEGDFGF